MNEYGWGGFYEEPEQFNPEAIGGFPIGLPNPAVEGWKYFQRQRGFPAPPPAEREAPETRFMKTYQDFLSAGGSKMEFEGDDGTKTQVAIKRPKPPEQQPGQPIQPQQPGQPQQPQMQPLPGQPQPWSTGMQQWPAPEEEAGMLQQGEVVARRNLYAPRYRPGEEPISPREEYAKRLELIKLQRAEREEATRVGLPTRGELLAQGYQNVAARQGKGMRILMSILTSDPFYTDKMAGAEAEYERTRRQLSMDRTLSTIDIDYMAKSASLDKLISRETTERATAAADLTDRLKTDPELAKNRKFQKDYAMTKLGIPAAQVDAYVDDHFNKNTGEYTIIRDPYSESILQTKNAANVIKELYPTLSNDIAITAVRNPSILLTLATDEIGGLNIQIQHEKNPARRAILEQQRNRLEAIKTSIAHDPNMKKLLMLEGIRDSAEWSRMSPTQKADWGKKYKDIYDLTYGPSPQQDPEKLFLDKKHEAEIIRNTVLQNKRLQESIEEKGKPTNVHEEIIASFPGQQIYKDKKASEKTKKELILQHQMLAERAMAGDTFKADSPEAKKDKAYMDHYRATVWRSFPPEIQQQLGQLSYQEAVIVSQIMSTAQMSDMTYNIYDIANKIANARRNSKPRK